MTLQKTIANKAVIEGNGLHTGNFCKVTLHPAQPNEGLVCICNQKKHLLTLDVVADTTRSTNVRLGNQMIYTIEHLLSAISALQIDNIYIEIEGNEVPILDGSAKYFVEKMLDAGIKEFTVPKKIFKVTSVIEWTDDSTNASYTFIPADQFSVTCLIDYDSKVLGQQYARLGRWEDYATEIASAKTFCFLHEIETLYHNGLIKGGNLTNSLVFSEHPTDPEKARWLSSVFNQPVFSIPEKGILNPVSQTFSNEAARHKILDLIGDLALLGISIQGKIYALKSGHTSNIRFAKYLKDNLVSYQINKESISLN